MSIFIGQLIGFALIVFLLWKYAFPPLNRAVKASQSKIEDQVRESEAAKANLIKAQAAHDQAVADAAVEAEQLKADGASDAQAITEDLHAAAEAERKRIAAHGASQADLQRANLLRDLRGDLGRSAVARADELVRAQLSDPAEQSATVDRLLDELSAMSGSARPDTAVATSADLVGLHGMRASSREAAQAVSREANAVTGGLDAAALTSLGGELASIVALLNSQPVLRKKLAEPSDAADAKKALVTSLLSGKVSEPALAITATASAEKWSTGADFTAALQRQSDLSVLAAAENEGVIDRVEDELFRVGRLLDANPELTRLLSDHNTPGTGRASLLQQVLGDQVGAHTSALLSQTVTTLNGQPADIAVANLAELAAARRSETVAHVISALALTDAQHARLTSVLADIYGRAMSVQTEIDPALLGGLRISVGDDVIEGDVATRLATAAENLPR
ncbi:F0F1 ATP synthase subunit B/delta [Gordonia sp. TBRC 11910]|uniref:Multifunctional fusion protein n=1 Tax=Gordonia asplenii TaxID=2725283 RepID=A0A848L928_9ACTN|nr:F0F1 ATP synthase subunit B/delta [Gordonia asplenii]NMO04971.1 F0F1 ATP synthase subunit B/delta [Gordonia asplenii]